MATEDDWAAYRSAVVDLHLPDRDPCRLVPDPSGATGDWPDGLGSEVFIVTAWDPDSVGLERGENDSRHKLLVAELRAAGVAPWPAVGRDVAGDHAEEGVGLTALDEAAVLALGRRYGQAAVYRWSPERWEVVSCTDRRRESSGWHTEPLTS